MGWCNVSDTFSWNAASGSWSVAADWSDLTSAASNTAIIAGPGSSFFTIAGPDDTAALTSGDVVFGGLFSVGTLTSSGGLERAFGTTRNVTTETATGLLEVQGARLSVSGEFTLAGFYTVSISNHASVDVGGLALSGQSSLSLDSTSVLEVGAACGATAETLTVDAGAITLGGTIVASITAPGVLINGTISELGLSLSNVVNNGTIENSDLSQSKPARTYPRASTSEERAGQLFGLCLRLLVDPKTSQTMRGTFLSALNKLSVIPNIIQNYEVDPISWTGIGVT
jgi:hypothetical protein